MKINLQGFWEIQTFSKSGILCQFVNYNLLPTNIHSHQNSSQNLAFLKSHDEFSGHAVKILFLICLASNSMVSRQTRQAVAWAPLLP